MNSNDIERKLQREVMPCPECVAMVHTVAAESVPAQTLRACVECDAVFFMDLEPVPVYA